MYDEPIETVNCDNRHRAMRLAEYYAGKGYGALVRGCKVDVFAKGA